MGQKTWAEAIFGLNVPSPARLIHYYTLRALEAFQNLGPGRIRLLQVLVKL